MMLAGVPFLREGLPVVRNHHERWDGRGYPDRLAGTDIPTLARVVAVVDAYDAMSSNRVYRAALNPDDVQSVLRSGAGEQWDAELIEVWCQLLRSGVGASESASPERTTAPQADAVSPSTAGVPSS